MKYGIVLLLSIMGFLSYAQQDVKNQSASDTVKKATLQEIIVVSGRKALDKASEMASKLPLKNIQNPQVINSVNHLIIEQQGITDFPTVLRNIPGLTRNWASISPFYSTRGFVVRNYIRNGMVSYATSDMDPANLEQVDVVKGPVGTLFGSSSVSFGGMINRVTKRPFLEQRIAAGYQMGSYNLHRFTMDTNSPLNHSKSLLLRLNMAHTKEESFQDAGYLKSLFIAPSLQYTVNKRLDILLEAEIYNREGTSLPQFMPIGPKQTGNTALWASSPEQLKIDYHQSFSNNSIILKDPALNFFGKITYKLSDSWKSETNIIKGQTANTGDYLTFSIGAGDTLIQRNVTHYATSNINTFQFQQNFIGDFKIGTVRNRFIAGIDFYQLINESESNTLNGRAGRPAYDRFLRSESPMAISPDLILEKLKPYPSTATKSSQKTMGIYLAEVINPIKPLTVMLSARLDRYLNDGVYNTRTDQTTGAYRQNSFSPKIGLLYELLESQLSLFANYNNGFQNVAPISQPDGKIVTFKPQYANQKEVGIKTDLLKNKLTATLSYYDIRVKNTLRPAVENPNFTVQEGNQFSKGIELDASANPITGLLLKLGWAYNQSIFTEADPTVNGLRPVNSGPKQSLNWYASYGFSSANLQGLGIGVGGNLQGKNYLINNSVNGQFYTNSYTLINANMFYEKTRYRVSINGENIGNKRHYFGGYGTFTPGTLRKITASLFLKI